MSMPAVTSWCWDMAGVLLPLWVRFGPTIFYMCHRRIRAEHNLGLLIPFEPVCCTYRAPRNPDFLARTSFCQRALAGWASCFHERSRANGFDRRYIRKGSNSTRYVEGSLGSF